MKKEEYRELMYLSIYGELSADEQSQLDSYLKKNPELQSEMKELLKLKSVVSEHTSTKTSENLLHEARAQLRNELRLEKDVEPFTAKINNWFSEIFSLKFVFSGTAALSLGILIGYCSFSNQLPENGLSIQAVNNSTKSPDMTRIENIRFVDSDASDGEIEFEFNAVAPMRLKGKVNDPEIQNVLTQALLNESNAGIRLESMNAISQNTVKKKPADPAIKTALISSLKNDENPGVRREALRVLQQFEFDNDIRDAVLQVLIHDSNSGMRIAAINALDLAKLDGKNFDDKVANVLKQQIKTEQNSYIRNRAATLVKEIYQ